MILIYLDISNKTLTYLAYTLIVHLIHMPRQVNHVKCGCDDALHAL